MVKEAYVNLEVAKLLQEKGFDIECNNAYYNGRLIDYTMYGFCGALDFIFAPTQQMAMAWLREVYNIFIVTDRYSDISCNFSFWQGDNYYENPLKKGFPSYEETVESALKYILEKIIK